LLKLIKENKINLIINTPSGQKSQSDMRSIRAAAILQNVPCITTIQGAWAAINGIESSKEKIFNVKSLQEYYRKGVLTVCGIVGVSNHEEAAKIVFLSLYALQHRGEESCGILSFDGKKFTHKKLEALLQIVFNENSVESLKGTLQ